MPVLPALKPLFDAFMASMPDANAGKSPQQMRTEMHAMIDMSFGAMAHARPPVAVESDHTVPVKDGEITVRVYRPVKGGPVLPCFLFLHGGGFWLGTLDQSDNNCRAISAGAGCVVVSVDYRLAPEFKFPTAAEDSYAALLWVAAHAETLGIDPSRIAVGGGSAGGNLAAVVPLMARDRKGPKLVLQLLEIPVTDFTCEQPLRFPSEGVTVQGKKTYSDFYLRSEVDALNPLASPMFARSLDDLPPAVIMTAEYDPLRIEAEAYARRLMEAGVEVLYHCWEGQFHGSQAMDKVIPEQAAAYRKMQVQVLRRAYGTD